jgi:hypothetical protein
MLYCGGGYGKAFGLAKLADGNQYDREAGKNST